MNGEIYISKAGLPPARSDIRHCHGDEDPACIADGMSDPEQVDTDGESEVEASQIKALWGIGRRYKLWELFFAHRDYFWRLGLCVPGGDPWDWSRHKYNESTMTHEL